MITNRLRSTSVASSKITSIIAIGVVVVLTGCGDMNFNNDDDWGYWELGSRAERKHIFKSHCFDSLESYQLPSRIHRISSPSTWTTDYEYAKDLRWHRSGAIEGTPFSIKDKEVYWGVYRVVERKSCP